MGCSVLMNLPTADAELYRIIAGIAAVLGHNFTCWLKFKGGKGIATSAGVFFALAPLAAGHRAGRVDYRVRPEPIRFSRVHRCGGGIARRGLDAAAAQFTLLGIATTALGLLAIAKHKRNIERLFNGTEQRFGKKSATPEATK